MQKATNLMFLVLGLLIIISGWFVFTALEKPPTAQPVQPGAEIGPLAEEAEKDLTLVIDRGEGEQQSFNIAFEKGITPLKLLAGAAGEAGFVLETKTFEIGTLLEAIGDIKNGQDGKYWLYYVNGEMPPLACDKKELEPGDKVEFKFEASPF